MPSQNLWQLSTRNSGIETRAGPHCAPEAHRAVGSFDSGGTVRFSLGLFTTAAEVTTVIEALRQIATTSYGTTSSARIPIPFDT